MLLSRRSPGGFYNEVFGKYGKKNRTTAGQEVEKLLGEIYLRKGMQRKALNLFLKILPTYEAAANRRELGKLYILLAQTQRTGGNLEAALQYYQMALTAFLPEFTQEDPTVNPDPEQLTREIWLIEIFREKGICFFSKYETSQDLNWLFLAEKQFELAVQCIQSIKLAFDEMESKLSTRAYSNPFYEDLLKAKLTLFHRTKQKKYAEEAFLVAQEANAFVLREMLHEQKALQVAGVSEDTIALLKHYREQLNELNHNIAERETSKVDTLQKRWFESKQKQAKASKIEEVHRENVSRVCSSAK